MGIYSDVALVMNSKGLECLNAQLEKLDKDARDDVLEFLDWADEEAESASEWLLCWRDIKWYGDDTIDVLVGILDVMPEAYYKFRRADDVLSATARHHVRGCGRYARHDRGPGRRVPAR